MEMGDFFYLEALISRPRSLHITLLTQQHLPKGKVGLDTNDPSTLESTIFAALNNIRARGNFSADTLEYFLNKDPKLARFYLLPKIYKRLHNVPGRLVFSNCGYYTENNSSFLDYQLQRLDKKVKSYIKDTIIFSKSLKNQVVYQKMQSYVLLLLLGYIPISHMRKLLPQLENSQTIEKIRE